MSYRLALTESFQKKWRSLPSTELQEAVIDYIDLIADDPGGLTQRNLRFLQHGVISHPLIVTIDDERFVLFVVFAYDSDEQTLHIRNLGVVPP